jgi:UDPglucose 6-dehydrogenase
MGMDPRIGKQFLNAGLGFGGFCLPKDIQAFIKLAERAGIDFALLKQAEAVNRQRIDIFLDKAKKSLWVMRDKHIGVLGLAFKANTDDIRFAPAIELIRRLLAEGSKVCAFDPEAMERTKAIYPNIQYAADAYGTAKDADALMLVTEWEQFKNLDWQRIHDSMARPLLLDGRNLLDPAKMKAIGFEYHSMGRPD